MGAVTVVVEVAGVLDAGGIEDCHRVFLDAPVRRGGDGGRRRVRGRHFRGFWEGFRRRREQRGCRDLGILSFGWKETSRNRRVNIYRFAV